MGEKYLEMNTPTGEISAELPKYEELQEVSWDVLEQFHQTASVNTALGRKYAEYDSMTLSDLRDALFNDSKSKHKGFRAMYNAVNDLLNLSAGKGRYFDENGNGLTKDFFETLFTAMTSVNQYLSTHSGYRWLEKGERRVQIATRLSYLLKDLAKEVSRVQSELPAKKARMVEYAKEGLSEEEIEERERLLQIDDHSGELMRFVETGEFGPKKSFKGDNEAAKKWIINGYSDELKKLIGSSGVLDGSAEVRDDFAAYITDQNNRLIANRMAVSIIVEADKEATLGMPWLKSELLEYLGSGLDSEQMLTKTTEFADLVRNKVESFKNDNKERLSLLKTRRDMLVDALHVPAEGKDFYSYSMIKELVTEPDDEVFKEKLAAVRETVKTTDRQIKNYLDEHFSEATRGYVTKELIRFIGAYRVVAKPMQVMNQVRVFCDMIKYTAPKVNIVEQSILNMMKDLKIDIVRRDHYVMYISDSKPERLMHFPVALFRSKAEKYAENVKINSGSFVKLADAKGCYLSKAQWDELEKINLMSGAMKNSEFKAKLEAVLEEDAQGQKLSRNEYLTERRFLDAQNEPARVKRAERERELIKKMGVSMRQKFLLHLSGNGENIYSDYIKLDAAYKGTSDKLKEQDKNQEELFEERATHLKHSLQRGGVPNNLWPGYIRKLDYLLRGISEATPDMNIDERLYAERMNLERFGVKNLDEVLKEVEQVGAELAKAKLCPDGSVDDIEALCRIRDKYDKGCDFLKKYDGGKYAEFVDILTGIPEVFGAMMETSAEEFEAFLEGTVDEKLGAFLEGVRLSGKQSGPKEGDRYIVPGAVIRQYAYSYIRGIYDGSLKGDASFFKNQLEGYNDKVFKVKADGLHSIADNIKSAEKLLDKELSKLGKNGAEALGLKLAVLAKIYDMANDTKEFLKLMDKDLLSEYAVAELEKVIGSEKDDNFSDEVKDSIVKQFTDNLPPVDEEVERKKGEIQKSKASGTRARTLYLGMNPLLISDIRQGKSLIRVAEKGMRRIKLDSSMADEMRGRIQKYCSCFDLPTVLVDALVEEGSSEAFTDRVKGIMWDSDKLQKHAFAMNKLNHMLMADYKDDTAMSPEEAQMYIIRLYGNPASRELFEKEGGPDVATLRTGNEYRLFRKNYEKLTLLEGEESGIASIERERMEQSRNLRTMLITGTGVLDSDGKTIDSTLLVNEDERCALLETMSDIIDRNKRYLDYSSRLIEIIRRQLQIEKRDKQTDYDDHLMDMKTVAIRDYLMKDLIKTLEAGDAFDEKTWTDKLEKIYGDPDIWENIVFDRSFVSDEMYAQAKARKLEHSVSEETIADVIDNSAYLFRNRVNSYKRLDEDQKKLFAIALMVMDKGAIGYGAQGSIELINAKSVKAGKLARVREELDKYVSGQLFDPDIDYKEALSKLVNYGETNVFYMEGYTLSNTAYDKALSFVNALTAKKIAFMEKDYERLGYGYESINTAFVKYGMDKQLNEVDKLRDEVITLEDVRTKLIEYAGNDTPTMEDIGKDMLNGNIKNLNVLSSLDQHAAHRMKMNRIKTHLQGLTQQDLKIFARIMQERSVIDVSRANTGDGTKLFVDQEKRNALIETLSSDSEISASVLEGFDDVESCYRVLVNALSFQLRDDIDFRNKDLTKDHFVDGALKRTTLADWDLVERALDLLDEIRGRRAAVYALSHASDFIEQSGNMGAIQENRSLESQYGKRKEEFTREKFEKYVKQQAEKDNEEDVKRAVAGYHALTEREKNLFFTVLSSRDLLDISRKDYKKSFFGIKDRNYVNQAGRDKLIDRYIESSLEGNVGIIAEEGAHYDALKMLFSTQISDRERFDTDKSLESMMVVERNLFMGRATAIDWKLFKRALNFVNRASEELEYAEGNAQLYRGAGDLWDNGRLDMSYSFLRKNFHHTGNQWGRYLGRLFVRTARQELHMDVLDSLVETVDIVELGAKYGLGLKEDGLARKGLAWLRNQVDEGAKTDKPLSRQNAVDFNAETLKTKTAKPSEEEKELEEESHDQLTYYQSVKEGIDDIFAEGKIITDTLKQTRTFLRESLASPLADHIQQLKFLAPDKQIKAKAEKDNIVEKYAPTTGTEDNRSDVHKAVNKVSENSGYAVRTWQFADKMPFTKNLTQLMKYTAEKVVYKLILGDFNEEYKDTNLSGIDNSKTLDDPKLLQKEIDEYVSFVFKDLLDSSIGEEHADELYILEECFHAIKSPMAKTISSVINKINYAKKCVMHATNISACISNRNLLVNNEKDAKKLREDDDKKLKKANEHRLSDEQAEQVKTIVDKHRGLAELSGDLSTAVLDFNIAGEAVNFAIETATIAGGKLNLGQYVISRAIKEGLQFAMFALRIASDRKSLADYYLHTEVGKSTVGRIRKGFSNSGNTALVDQLDKAISLQKTAGVSSLVDIISDARGYEHTSELVENTAMSMAQSIVFCASSFNPMAETKLMAITVMSVMGLGSEIGSTSPATVEKLFNSFRLTR